jgi:dihydrofolate synthase/folylpolyglutamate synthase
MSIEIEYQKKLDYIYTFIDYSMTRDLRYSPEKFNLDRMKKFLDLMGNPHKAYKNIHVAGTKGKGSTSAMISNVLIQSGLKTGFYTSPHLIDFCERIQVDSLPIPHEMFIELVDYMIPFIEKTEEITTFELTTALAFLYFRREKVDIAVMEVGLGGRLDATNVVDPLVSVITSLSLDHVNVLGDTLAKIAYEKGGIIKPGRPVVVAPQKEEAQIVLEKIANDRNSPLIQVGKDYLYAAASHDLNKQSFYVWPKEEQPLVNMYIESGGRDDWEPVRLQIPLLGFHQVQNAATAYCALQTVKKDGIDIHQIDIYRGFSKVNWPGRFEILSKRPLIVIDSAHNRESALRLRNAIDDYFPGVPKVLLFGASEDKDIHGMLVELIPRVKTIVATMSKHPRAIDPEVIVNYALQFGLRGIKTSSIEEGLEKAISLAGDEALILVTGSLFVAGAARDVWINR